MPYFLSLIVGLGVGLAYGLLGVRSPAPPVIALLGLLGMLLGEQAVAFLRGHPGFLAEVAHRKSFTISEAPASAPAPTRPGQAESRQE
jgi:XapX domain-containing protein